MTSLLELFAHGLRWLFTIGWLEGIVQSVRLVDIGLIPAVTRLVIVISLITIRLQHLSIHHQLDE